jgi:hypothetical protein
MRALEVCHGDDGLEYRQQSTLAVSHAIALSTTFCASANI